MQIPGISSDQLKVIKSFLPKGGKIMVFGSRAKGNYRENSDLDLCIMTDISRSEVTRINEMFEESNLPFTVDIVLYNDCSDDFKKIIDTMGILI